MSAAVIVTARPVRRDTTRDRAVDRRRGRSSSGRRPLSAATYRRRRAVVGTALAVFVAVGAVTAYDVLAGSGGDPASASVSQPARTMIVAERGDTLWAIASRHHGEVSMARYVDRLVSLNGGSTIVPGQTVILP